MLRATELQAPMEEQRTGDEAKNRPGAQARPDSHLWGPRLCLQPRVSSSPSCCPPQWALLPLRDKQICRRGWLCPRWRPALCCCWGPACSEPWCSCQWSKNVVSNDKDQPSLGLLASARGCSSPPPGPLPYTCPPKLA